MEKGCENYLTKPLCNRVDKLVMQTLQTSWTLQKAVETPRRESH